MRHINRPIVKDCKQLVVATYWYQRYRDVQDPKYMTKKRALFQNVWYLFLNYILNYMQSKRDGERSFRVFNVCGWEGDVKSRGTN